MTSNVYIYVTARALKDCIAATLGTGVDFGDLHVHTSLKHLNWMMCEIGTGRVTGSKAHRWLGYVQGALVAKGYMTHDEIKDIISKYKE